MARPRKTEAPDLTKPCDLTAGTIERLTCTVGKSQSFLRDSLGNGLRVRVTPTGKKTFIFEQSLKNQTIRRTIGEVSAWSIDAARAEAKRLSVMLDDGTDPRELAREQAAAKAAERVDAAARVTAAAAQVVADALTVREVWARYVAERQPKWGERNYSDHLKIAQEGGKARTRGEGVTKPGPLAPFMPMRLIDLDAGE